MDSLYTLVRYFLTNPAPLATLAFFAYTPLSKRLGKGNPEDDKKAQEIKDNMLNKLLSFVPKYSDL
jgi:hypothetical protein